MDTTPDAYDNLKTAFYEDRVKYYAYEPVLKELQDLQETWHGKRRKIDHPPKKSKDVADALAGVCFKLRQNALRQPLPMLMGSGTTDESWGIMAPTMSLNGESVVESDNVTSGSRYPLPFLTG